MRASGFYPKEVSKQNNQIQEQASKAYDRTNEPFLCCQRGRHCCACIGLVEKEGAHNESERSIPSLALSTRVLSPGLRWCCLRWRNISGVRDKIVGWAGTSKLVPNEHAPNELGSANKLRSNRA